MEAHLVCDPAAPSARVVATIGPPDSTGYAELEQIDREHAAVSWAEGNERVQCACPWEAPAAGIAPRVPYFKTLQRRGSGSGSEAGFAAHRREVRGSWYRETREIP